MKESNVSKENHAADKAKDVSSKTVFHNPVLCSQFLRDNLDIPILKNVQPEDIEDVSERYQAYLGVEFEADTVKKIRLRESGKEDTESTSEEEVPLYLISLIEHKSDVDYNVAMQILRYMVCIWTEYARDMEQKKKGITRNKSFRYPPVLPIVYYEGTKNWTADLQLKDRIWMNGKFGEYMPNFTYQVVRAHDYSNEELLNRGDGMSLIMMINKIQSVEDFEQFRHSQPERMNEILKSTPENIRGIIRDVMYGLLMKMNVPVSEAKQYVELVEECRMGYLFENMEKIDIQEERRNTARARKDAEEAKKDAEEAKKDAEEAKKDAEEAQKQLEDMVKTYVSACRELGGNKSLAVDKLIEKCGLSREEAEEKVERYWEG